MTILILQVPFTLVYQNVNTFIRDQLNILLTLAFHFIFFIELEDNNTCVAFWYIRVSWDKTHLWYRKSCLYSRLQASCGLGIYYERYTNSISLTRVIFYRNIFTSFYLFLFYFIFVLTYNSKSVLVGMYRKPKSNNEHFLERLGNILDIISRERKMYYNRRFKLRSDKGWFLKPRAKPNCCFPSQKFPQ